MNKQGSLTPSDGVSDINKHEGETLRIASKKIGVGRETLKNLKKVEKKLFRYF